MLSSVGAICKVCYMKYLRPGVSAVLILLGMLCACAAIPPPKEPSLYQRLGGKDAVVSLVDNFIDNVVADKRINTHFRATGTLRLKQEWLQLICAASAGPCIYTEKDIGTSLISNQNYSEQDFSVLLKNMRQTLSNTNLPVREKNEVLGIMVTLKYDFIMR